MNKLAALITAPVRVPVELLIALPQVARDLPGAISDLRVVLRELERLASEDGELSAALRESASLAARSGDASRTEASPASLTGRAERRRGDGSSTGRRQPR